MTIPKIYIRKYVLIEFAFGLAIAVITIIIAYWYNSVNNPQIEILVIDVFFKTLTLTIVLEVIKHSCRNTGYSGASFMLYVSVLYNQNSIVKYMVDSLYVGSIDRQGTRLIGSLYINIILFTTTILWSKYHIKSYSRTIARRSISIRTIKVSKSIEIFLVALYAIVQFYSLFKTGKAITFNKSRFAITMINSITYLTYSILIINIHSIKKKIHIDLSFISLIVLAVTNLVLTAVTGTKSYFVVFVTVIILGLLYVDKIAYSVVKIVAYVSPLAFQLITISSELLSQRMSSVSIDMIQRYHAFRFDLSDFAITIASRYQYIGHPFKVLWEAIELSVPSFINPTKVDNLANYKQHITSVGLNPVFDYPDTFFSMGAQILGYAGIALVFICIMYFFEWLSLKIERIKLIGPVLFILSIRYFATCESDWSMFIYNTRDLFVTIVFSYIILKVFSKKISDNGNQFRNR